MDTYSTTFEVPRLGDMCPREGHPLMLYTFNKYGKEFIAASLYLRWQVTFQTLLISVKVMQVRDPRHPCTYICQMGCQPAQK